MPAAAAVQYAPFCALCTSDVGPFAQHPLGRNNGLVWVCRACDEEPAVYRGGPERPYEPGGGFGPAFKQQVRTATKAIAGVGDDEIQLDMRQRTEGWVLIRVPNRPGRDALEALEAYAEDLADEPWFDAIRFLGTTAKYHLFERPPT